MASVLNGKSIIIYINDKPVCAQKNIEIDRSATTIDITNKIDGDWKSGLQGLKTWKIKCNGVYVVNDEAFLALEESFEHGSNVKIAIIDKDLRFEGEAIITSFPLNVDYEDALTYRLALLGDGPLRRV